MFSLLKTRQWKKKYNPLIQQAYSHSSFKGLGKSYDWFLDQICKLSNSEENDLDFDDAFYLDANPDVKACVLSGEIPCGYVHFLLHGAKEQRPYSDKSVEFAFNVPVKYPSGLFKPSSFLPLQYFPDLRHLNCSDSTKTLVVFVPYLQKELFFAGYTAFFNDIKNIFSIFDEVKIYVTNSDIDEGLVKGFGSNIVVDSYQNISSLSHRPDLIYVFDSETYHQARDIFSDKGDIIYYCQDDEAGFHPFGTLYIRSRQVNKLVRNCIFSTKMLFDYFNGYGFLSDDCNSFITAPKIDLIPSEYLSNKRYDRKRIFFYYRPESFNSRNLDRIIIDSIYKISKEYSELDVFLVGSVATAFSRKIQGVNVYAINKLPKDEYFELLMSCDICVAMIYSAHPGVIAYQAAASGVTTITNTFSNRDAFFLRQISNNLVPYDPLVEDLASKIIESLNIPKKEARFNYKLYSGLDENKISFTDYNLNILRESHKGIDKWQS